MRSRRSHRPVARACRASPSGCSPTACVWWPYDDRPCRWSTSGSGCPRPPGAPPTWPAPSCSRTRCCSAPTDARRRSWPTRCRRWAAGCAPVGIPTGSRSPASPWHRSSEVSSTSWERCSPEPPTHAAASSGSAPGWPSRGGCSSRSHRPRRPTPGPRGGTATTPTAGGSHGPRRSSRSHPAPCAASTVAGSRPTAACSSSSATSYPAGRSTSSSGTSAAGSRRRAATRCRGCRRSGPAPLLLVDRPGSVQANLRFGGDAPSLSDPSYAAVQVADAIFTGLFSSRLIANLREDKGYTYGSYSTMRHQRAGSSLAVGVDVATDVAAPALVETVYELGRIVTLPPQPRRGGGGRAVPHRDRRAAHRHPVRSRGHPAPPARARAGRDVAPRPPRPAGGGGPRAGPRGRRRRCWHPGRLVWTVLGDADRLHAPLATVTEVTTLDGA